MVPGHQCPVQNFYGKYKKQLLSGNMRERKLICSYKFVKGNQSRKKKSSNFLNTKIFQVQESCWLIILFWALLKKLYASKILWPIGSCSYLKFVRQLGSDSLKASHLVNKVFAHAQTCECCVVQNESMIDSAKVHISRNWFT